MLRHASVGSPANPRLERPALRAIAEPPGRWSVFWSWPRRDLRSVSFRVSTKRPMAMLSKLGFARASVA